MQPDGWLEIVLGDAPGWRSFASFSGPEEGRRFQLTTRHAFDGMMIETLSDMAYDATVRRFAAFGSTSDGSLSNNSLRSRIVIAALDRQAWDVGDIVFGWVQLNDQA